MPIIAGGGSPSPLGLGEGRGAVRGQRSPWRASSVSGTVKLIEMLQLAACEAASSGWTAVLIKEGKKCCSNGLVCKGNDLAGARQVLISCGGQGLPWFMREELHQGTPGDPTICRPTPTLSLSSPGGEGREASRKGFPKSAMTIRAQGYSLDGENGDFWKQGSPSSIKWRVQDLHPGA